MPRATQSVIARLTHLFMELDGGEQATVLDVFKTLHARLTARLPTRATRPPRAVKPAPVLDPTPTTPSGKPMRRPRSKTVKPLVPEPVMTGVAPYNDLPAEPAE